MKNLFVFILFGTLTFLTASLVQANVIIHDDGQFLMLQTDSSNEASARLYNSLIINEIATPNGQSKLFTSEGNAVRISCNKKAVNGLNYYQCSFLIDYKIADNSATSVDNRADYALVVFNPSDSNLLSNILAVNPIETSTQNLKLFFIQDDNKNDRGSIACSYFKTAVPAYNQCSIWLKY